MRDFQNSGIHSPRLSTHIFGYFGGWANRPNFAAHQCAVGSAAEPEPSFDKVGAGFGKEKNIYNEFNYYTYWSTPKNYLTTPIKYLRTQKIIWLLKMITWPLK